MTTERHIPTYTSWAGMIQRCTNRNGKQYHRYGGRGITICERWRASFLAFLADMGQRPDGDYSIDRIDNDGNYEPGNCRWATRKEQSTNRPHAARPGAGRPPLEVTRSVRRVALLTPAEAALHDAARGEQGWGDWIREAAELAIARGSTR